MTVLTVTSADGTPIAYEQRGSGTPVVLVGGAFNDRTTVAALADVLAAEHTVITYDRRGRGGSGTAPGYAVEREIEDLAAVAGAGPVDLFGHSSGAVLAIEAALRGLPVRRLAVYEPPYLVGDVERPAADVGARLQALVALDRRDDAVALFLTESAGVPAAAVAGMRADASWGWLRALAHTLPHDVALFEPGSGLPVERVATLGVPTLCLVGGESDARLQGGARALAEVVPGARLAVVDGQDHGVLHAPETLRSLLLEHFA